MLRYAVIGLAVVAACAGASTPGTPQRIRCPVGGKAFSFTGYASYSRWGALPDGQPVGSAPFPLAIPECPDNGLVVFDEFDAATVAKLTPLIASADYQQLRGETQRYRVQWLQAKLGGREVDVLWTLLAASWEAKNGEDAARATRYGEEFVRRTLALPDDPTSLAVLALKARAVNALRELGRAAALRGSLFVVG